MSSSTLRNPHQMAQLERVVLTRMRSAEQALNKELTSLRLIEKEIEERQAKVDVFKNDLLELQIFLSSSDENGQPVAAVEYQRGLERRYWIDYDKQREIYYLEMTHDEHREQTLKVNVARVKFKSLECKHDILHKQLQASKRQTAANKSLKQEAENQDSRFHVTTMGGGNS